LLAAAECALTGLETISRPQGFAAIERLADATGIMQHSRYSVPDPDHGYCVDDNARALILMHRRRDLADAIHDPWVRVFANFVARAWNPARGRFRNFMSYDGAWLEEAGSEDSCGRALWSLGVTSAEARSPALRAWAAALFEEAAGPMLGLRWPRSMAFCVLGATAAGNRGLAVEFADRLARLASAEARPGWTWFEPELSYDNCRLPEALLRAGLMLDRNDLIDTGLETLAWIAARQTAPEGHFRAVGSESFGRAYCAPAQYDQQPLEAQGMVEACAAAFAATGDQTWIAEARKAWAWFHGANDGGVALGEPASGECYDGLTRTGANLNRGAESVLAYQLAACAMARLAEHGAAS
jgi:hypothetical protein